MKFPKPNLKMARPRLADLHCAVVLLGSIACAPPEKLPDKPASRSAKPPEAPGGMVLIPGGTFMMGDNEGFSHEGPEHQVRVDPFWMDIHEVTNDQFARFVEAAGYKTDAERWGWSIGYDPSVKPEDASHEHVPGVEWWVKIEGADWRHPTGPASSIEGRGSHPVVQVSWNDAAAYCTWVGGRLPTEAEWEFAARGGMADADYPWGDALQPEGRDMANLWQGHFPVENSGADGFADLAPVGSFAPNGYGLHDIAGNVWEWVQDWYDPKYYSSSPAENPPGPPPGDKKVMRGGSWMCSSNYCMGYRVSHRNKASPDSGLNNTGFRCAKDAK